MNNDFNWDSVEAVSESKFLILGVKTQIRMGSNFKAYGMHLEDDLMGNKKRANCPGDGCPLCEIGKKSIKRYAFKVINRANEQVYILETGGMIMNEIKKNAQNPIYGNPLNYDILISKTGTGKQTKYTVIASPNKIPITPSETQGLAEMDIDKYIKPTSIEDIKAIGFRDLPMEVTHDEENTGNFDWDNIS